VPKHPIVKAVEQWQREAAELVAHKESRQGPPPTKQIPLLEEQSNPTIGESLG
jgi:hypothetical protein